MGIDRSWGAVVIDNEQKVLLVQHSSGQHWDHPKGHPNPGETPSETAIREIREEGNVDVTLINGFQMREAWNLPDGRRKEVVYYLGKKTGAARENQIRNTGLNMPTAVRGSEGDPPDEEILGRVWLSYHEALEKITYEAGKRVLREAVEYLKRHGI